MALRKSHFNEVRMQMNGFMQTAVALLRRESLRRWLAPAVASVAVWTACTQTRSDTWVDPASHQVLMIAVAPRVQLEVLDWGGKHLPIVFLAGLGDTGHAFDTFAARFHDAFRPIAITRRGFGASSRPDSGYDSATRAHDILAVLDSLHIARAILVGHSIAGDELSRFAVTYPDRVSALVYLEAYSYGTDAPAEFPPYPEQAEPPRMTRADSASVQSVIAYWPRRFEYEPVEADVRAVCEFAESGRLKLLPAPNESGRVYQGTSRSEYSRVRAPALAIYAPHASLADLFPRASRFDEQNRAAAMRYLSAQQQYEARQMSRFRAEVRGGVVVTMPGTSHYVHYRSADAVENTMRTFLRGVSIGAGEQPGT